MKAKLIWGLLCVFCFCVAAEQVATAQWTDKNNTQKSAAYMLRVSYSERGYMGAQVVAKQDHGNDVFVVKRGPVYHVKELAVTGLSDSDAKTIMQDAPKAGDMYSAARMNDWIKDIRKSLQEQGRAEKPIWGVHLDHAHAQAVLTVEFQ